MIHTLYIERDVTDHPRTLDLQRHFPAAARVYCDRYTEIFNRKSQNFRLQKKRPALILAAKFRQRLLPVPTNHGLGAPHSYYFSHMLNCIYDCRYCYLQGMFRSAHYVVFVNYEDFAGDIKQALRQHGDDDVHFFSGYDCDSLALEPLTRFAQYFIPLFEQYPQALLELRTKSTQVRSLLAHGPVPNCIVAFSFTPPAVAAALEHKTPAVARRIEAMAGLQQQGWLTALRFDPLIHENNYRDNYRRLFKDIFTVINADRLHSITLGGFRLPGDFFSNMLRLYPDEPLLAALAVDSESMTAGRKGTVAYRADLEAELLDYCTAQLQNYVGYEKIHYCHNS